MFKDFFYDWDKVYLDEIILKRPSYITVADWVTKWHNFFHPIDIEKLIQELNSEHDSDLDKSLSDQEDELLNDFEKDIEKISNRVWEFLDNEELIANKEMREYIQKQIDGMINDR